MPYLQVIRKMHRDGILLLTSSLSAMLIRDYWPGVAQKMKIKDLKITVFLFLDVACLGSKSRMRLFPCGGTFYTMIFPCF